MIAYLKAVARRSDLSVAEDVLGAVALFAILIVALSLPATY